MDTNLKFGQEYLYNHLKLQMLYGFNFIYINQSVILYNEFMIVDLKNEIISSSDVF